MMKTVSRFVMTAAIAASMTTGAWAVQEAEADLGSVTGRITDSEKRVLPGASVIVEDLHTGVTTDINGYYKLPVLKPGTYTLKISYVGYAPITRKITVTDKKSQVNNFVMSEGHELKEIEVQGALSEQRRALQMQKSGMGLTNVVSADQAGKFPDSNIGDALKRISGINVQYDQGEARFGQVRGTSADLTSVTINGNRIPSAEGDTRNVQLDLIPSDMIQTIEVNKVVTSDMDGDAIGGEINLVTKNTPFHRVLNFMVGTGYSWISGKPQWNLGATWGQRFFDNKLGVMASASYQYAPGGSDNTEFEYDTDDDGVVLKEIQARQYYVTRERQSYSLALDYQFNPLNKISFKGIYNRRNDWENRFRVQYKDLDEDVQEITMETKAGADNTKDARLERQQTMDFTLDGQHYIGNLKIDWAASYSRATEERPNERYASIKYKDIDVASGLQDVGGRQPYTTVAIPSISDEGWEFDELTNQDEDIEENEYKARLNFELPLAKGRFGNKLKFGGKYTYKETKAPSGYALNPTAYAFEIDEKGVVAGTLIVTDPFANIVIKKVDAKTNKLLAGAQFGLYDSTDKLLTTLTTDNNGLVQFTKLPWGKYSVKELKAPSGYAVNGKLVTVEINETYQNPAEPHVVENSPAAQTGVDGFPWWGIALLVVCVLGGGGCAWYLLRKKQSAVDKRRAKHN